VDVVRAQAAWAAPSVSGSVDHVRPRGSRDGGSAAALTPSLATLATLAAGASVCLSCPSGTYSGSSGAIYVKVLPACPRVDIRAPLVRSVGRGMAAWAVAMRRGALQQCVLDAAAGRVAEGLTRLWLW
jgi:hypothetical protein